MDSTVWSPMRPPAGTNSRRSSAGSYRTATGTAARVAATPDVSVPVIVPPASSNTMPISSYRGGGTVRGGGDAAATACDTAAGGEAHSAISKAATSNTGVGSVDDAALSESPSATPNTISGGPAASGTHTAHQPAASTPMPIPAATTARTTPRSRGAASEVPSVGCGWVWSAFIGGSCIDLQPLHDNPAIAALLVDRPPR